MGSAAGPGPRSRSAPPEAGWLPETRPSAVGAGRMWATALARAMERRRRQRSIQLAALAAPGLPWVVTARPRSREAVGAELPRLSWHRREVNACPGFPEPSRCPACAARLLPALLRARSGYGFHTLLIFASFYSSL